MTAAATRGHGAFPDQRHDDVRCSLESPIRETPPGPKPHGDENQAAAKSRGRDVRQVAEEESPGLEAGAYNPLGNLSEICKTALNLLSQSG
jgi:hypothetical protein